jgi:hypothetical protein
VGQAAFNDESGPFTISAPAEAASKTADRISDTLEPGWMRLTNDSSYPLALTRWLQPLTGGDGQVVVRGQSGRVHAGGAFTYDNFGAVPPGDVFDIWVDREAELALPLHEESVACSTCTPVNIPGHYAASTVLPGQDVLILLVDVPGLADGDEVGAWSEAGELVGAARVARERAAIVVAGDNWSTEAPEGIAEGTRLALRAWSKAEAREDALTISSLVPLEADVPYEPALRYRSSEIWRLIVEADGPEDLAAALPERFELSENYPNPFNPHTTIRYALPEPAQVLLEVFNAMGQRVAVLANSVEDAGRYEVQWDARNAASGVYFYRISAGPFQQVRNMILLK